MMRMAEKTDRYTFKAVNSQNLILLSDWLKEPMVSRWYDDPNYIDHLEEHLNDSRIRMQIVYYNEVPIAYVQDYDIHAWTNHPLAFLPNKARGIDTFIGSSDLIGIGHGSSYLSILCHRYFQQGIPALGIDPHPDNILARFAYKKVGFVENSEVDSEWGRIVTMSLYPKDIK